MHHDELLFAARVAATPLPDRDHEQYDILLGAKANAEIQRRETRELAEEALYVFATSILNYSDFYEPLHRPLISCLCVTPVEGTAPFDQVRDGTFEMIGPEETLAELEGLLEHVDVSGAVFRSNHASNYLPLKGRLPADKARLLEAVRAARRGEVALKPEHLRGL